MEARGKKSAKGMKSTPSSSFSSCITNLPTPILMEILCRLPIKTLTASKCVCKSWLHIFRDPHFAQLHQARAPTEVCFQLCHEEDTSKLHMGNFHSLHNFDPLDVKISTVFEFPKFNVRTNTKLNVKGGFNFSNSCNGLLCYYGGYRNRFVMVWNPRTSEFITLPALNRHCASMNCCGYGLGFSIKANKYKLMRVVSRKIAGSACEDVVAEMCTIEKGCSWNTLGFCPSDVWRAFDYCSYSNNKDPLYATFLHGTLHWLSDRSGYGSDISILTFDFEDDRFGRVPLPPSFGKNELNTALLCRVGDLLGCLFITECTNEGMNIWLMKEYGVQDSWTKMAFLPCTVEGERLEEICFLPVTCLGNGEILLAGTNYTSSIVFFLYDPDLGGFRFIGYGPASLRVIPYRPSLVLLKDSMLGHKVYVSALKVREMSASPDWWTLHEKGDPSVEEEREGHVSATSESSVATPALQRGTEGRESHGRNGGNESIQVSAPVDTSAAELAHPRGSEIPLVTDGTWVSAIMEDTTEQIKNTMKKVMEKQRKEQRALEEKIEQLIQQNRQLEERLQDEKAKAKQMNEQIGQQNQQWEDILQYEHAKVKQLEEKLQRSEQLKEESRQMTIQMMDEMRARFMGSH